MNPKLCSSNQIITSGMYPFTKGQLNHLLVQRHKNGLEKAIVKIGKRIYFKIPEFDQWISEHTQKKTKQII
ncbi:MAG: hypothetical protein A3F09_03485 [Chlamydiae bacterium RIFCSPHIGHO2_12_FULL_49_11]|nr:MAG: hypothetical protein A3F09_03485 [Chlamydiae bacterium RIFCSPHIGHO2_12_FULL_49_11]